MENYEYKIYQVKKVFQRYHGFMGLDMYKSLMKQEVNISRYNEVYNNSIKLEFHSESDVLENLFKIFNIEIPKDFHGHSMSVGDIVEIFGKFYFCDSSGWKEISPENRIPTMLFEEYLSYEHNSSLEVILTKQKAYRKPEEEIEKFVNGLKQDFLQFCWENSFEAIL